MKKGMMALCAVILMMSMAGCGNKTVSHDVYSEIYERYNHMKSYTAEAEITVVSNSTAKQYTVRQYYTNDGKYKMEVLQPPNIAGTSCIFVGGDVYLNSSFGAQTVLEQYIPNDKDYLFVPDFFSEYYKSEENTVTSASDLSGEQTKLTSLLSGNNRYRFEQSLWVDNKTLLPSVMETYDVNGDMVLRVVYTDFRYNEKVDASVFDLQGQSMK